MGKRFILLYALYLSWALLLLERRAFEKWDYMKSLLVFVPLAMLFFLIYRNRTLVKDQRARIGIVAISLILLLAYYFLDHTLKEEYQMLYIGLILFGIGSMTIMILGSLHYHSRKNIEIRNGSNMIISVGLVYIFIKSCSYFVAERYRYLFDGVMIFAIIILYYRCFLQNTKNEESVGENHIEKAYIKKKEVKKRYVYVGIIILFLLSGYSIYLEEIEGIGSEMFMPYEPLLILVTVFGFILVWLAGKVRKEKEFIGFSILCEVVLYLAAQIAAQKELRLALMFSVQIMYVIMICILGGLVLRMVYLFGKKYKDLMYLMLGACFPIMVASLLLKEFVNNESAGFIGNVLLPLIGIVFYAFMKDQVMEIKRKK